MITHRNILTSLALVFLISIALFVLLFLETGCVSGNWQGLVPGKDVHLKNFKQEITTPWGHSLVTADELDTIVRADGTVQVSVPATVTPKP
jgi:hypothetical protein